MVTGVYGHQTRPHNLRHMSIDIEKNIEFLFRNMEDEIKERNRKRAEIWALKSFRDRSNYTVEDIERLPEEEREYWIVDPVLHSFSAKVKAGIYEDLVLDFGEYK